MKEKKLKLITEILAIVVVCLISFVGIYSQNLNKMENIVKEYELTKDFTGYRELVFSVNTETEGENENLNEENYKKSKKIIENRLKNLAVEDYNISLNNENGDIYLQIPENSETDHIVSNILQVADFKMTDSEDTSKVFLTNDDLKKVSAIYNTTTSGTTVYLQIKFNKNGAKVLKDLSTGEYAEKEEEETTKTEESEEGVSATVTTDENTSSSEISEETSTESTEEAKSEETQKKIALTIDGSNMITTSFNEPIEDGTLYLAMGQASTDSEKISDSIKSTSTIGVVLNSGKMPITYKISEDIFVNSNVGTNNVKYIVYSLIAIVGIALIFVVLKYKFKGIIAVIAYIGFIAIYLLGIRYTNVAISYESLVAIALIFAVNYLTIYKLLKINETEKDMKKIAYKNAMKSTISRLLPICIISVVFAFMKLTFLATFGMTLFWGIVLSIVYNYIITKDMLD